MRITAFIFGITVYLLLLTEFASADTLGAVQKKGMLRCGVSQGLPGFSFADKQGEWQGLDVAVCRAVATAIFGDPKKVTFVALNAKERFTALQSGEIDLLSRNTTWSYSRDVSLGLDFPAVIYYDGQGFMVRRKLNLKSVKELDGATICVNTGTTTELNVADYFRSHNLKYKLLAFEKDDDVIAAYEAERCDAYTTDQSGLYANRLKLKNPDDHMILPEIISKEPLSPATRHGDQKWTDLVRWTIDALTAAEELGITSQNVDQMVKSDNPEIRRLLGVEGNIGEPFGLKSDWAKTVIQKVGNYAQIFDTNLGSKSRLQIARAHNKLWRDGGLHYPLPFR